MLSIRICQGLLSISRFFLRRNNRGCALVRMLSHGIRTWFGKKNTNLTIISKSKDLPHAHRWSQSSFDLPITPLIQDGINTGRYYPLFHFKANIHCQKTKFLGKGHKNYRQNVRYYTFDARQPRSAVAILWLNADHRFKRWWRRVRAVLEPL